ncbi:MAG: phosphate/phosphite/phosphonate ABC transporter substrate-binding protein [Nitrospirae bacterium]|nr:phosphate/phosphite/phosphonate ABC transporter substrate-binding protein [Nitrospirota bacterium]
MKPLNNLTATAVILISLLLSLSACVKDEKPKKVSLYQKEAEAKPRNEAAMKDMSFGFELAIGPKEEIEIYTPFISYLEEKTGRRFQIKFSENNEEIVRNLGLGKMDFALIGSLSYVIGRQEYGINYLASGVNKEGDPQYHTAIITRPESGINTIKELMGKTFAFGEQMSTQGYLMPRKMLEEAGIKIEDISYVFTGSSLETVKMVLNGEKDAGSIQGTLALSLQSGGKVKIIGISGAYPSSIVAYNSSVDKETVEKVRSALLEFEPAGKHRRILYNWEATEMPLGFTTVDEAEIESIALLAERYGFLKR